MTKENHARCLANTLREEGGWSNHPFDSGGPTMRGVIQVCYNEYRRKSGKLLQSVRYIIEDELQTIYRDGCGPAAPLRLVCGPALVLCPPRPDRFGCSCALLHGCAGGDCAGDFMRVSGQVSVAIQCVGCTQGRQPLAPLGRVDDAAAALSTPAPRSGREPNPVELPGA